jgi:hypothetical protein
MKDKDQLQVEATPKRRLATRPAFIVTARDVAILRDLFDSRILTAQQIADIHFNGSRNASKQRLWTLKRAGLIAGRFGTPSGLPIPLRLTRDGFDILRKGGHLNDYPRLTWPTLSKRLKVSPLTLAHEVDVGWVKASFYRAARERGDTQINLAITWPRLLRFRVRPPHLSETVSVSPDGFIRFIQDDGAIKREQDVFIEVDRSTETISRIVERMQAYVAYYSTGGFAKRQSVANVEPKEFPFRVLWTFKTKARMESFLRACREHQRPILKMAWAVLFDEAVLNPFAKCYRRPVDSVDERRVLLPCPVGGQREFE